MFLSTDLIFEPRIKPITMDLLYIRLTLEIKDTTQEGFSYLFSL